MLALSHPYRDEPPHHVVDALVDLPGGVRAVLVQEQDVLRRALAALLQQQVLLEVELQLVAERGVFRGAFE